VVCPKSKAEALEIDIFYDDTRPLEGRNHLIHFAAAPCSDDLDY